MQQPIDTPVTVAANEREAAVNDLLREIQSAATGGSLRRSEQRVAEFVIAQPTFALDLTITDLAQRCDTSIASVARLCRSLGYSGYREFRSELAASVGREQVNLARFGVAEGDILVDDDAGSVVSKLAFHSARAIEATADALDVDSLDAVAEAIAAAPRVDIYGQATSGLAATDLHQKFHRIGVISYAWTDVHLALIGTAVLTEGCVAIGFSHSGLTVETADSLAAARANGATTVLVTNAPTSPIAKSVDLVVATNASETQFRPGALSGQVAQLLVVDVLFIRVVQRLAASATVALDETHDAVRSHRLSYRRGPGRSKT